MADSVDPAAPIETTSPLDIISQPLSPDPSVTQSGTQAGGGDPITGNGGSSSSYSDSSNGNQVAVLSTLDYSTTVSITNNQITYHNVSVVNQYGVVMPGAVSSTPGTAADSASGRSRVASGATGVRIEMRSSRYFRAGRVDRIIGFNPDNGDRLALSTEVFRGIGDMEFRSVTSRRSLRRACRSSADVIYLQPSGQLFFNANGAQRGCGDDGGLFAILEQSPTLTAAQLILV